MASDFQGPERTPAIFVGVGGTGVKTLRFLLSHVQASEDPALKRMLEHGELQFIGIDTDPGSNKPSEQLDPQMVPDPEHEDKAKKLPFQTLASLDNFILIEAEDISRALMAIRLDIRKQQSQNDTATDSASEILKHPEIAEWFPLPTKDGDEISYGQSRAAGAAQWRALGRAGLFLRANIVYQAIQAAHERIQGALAISNANRGKPRAYVVGSLAGGTGSGMFWDVSFMLRTISDELHIRGAFLLPDVFSELDRARRIMPNAYAALKELAYLKNWTWRESHEIRWPGCPSSFTAYQGGTTSFDAVYLYRDFKPSTQATDYAKARVDLSCYRMAENMLAQLRRDVFMEIDQGANNESGDITAHINDNESKYVFATSGVVEFRLHSLKAIQQAVWHQCSVKLYTQLNPMKPDAAQLSASELGYLGLTLSEQEIAKSLCENLAKKLDEVPPKPAEWRKQIAKVRDKLNKQLQKIRANQDASGDLWALEFDQLIKDFEQAVPAVIRNQWEADWEQAKKDSRMPRCYLTADAVYSSSTENAMMEPFDKGLSTLLEKMQPGNENKKGGEQPKLVLSTQHREALKALSEWLGTKVPTADGVGALIHLADWIIEAPQAYSWLSYTLKVQTGTGKEADTNLAKITKISHKARPPVPSGLRGIAIEYLMQLLDELSIKLDLSDPLSPEQRQDMVLHTLPGSTVGQQLADKIDQILAQSSRNKEKLSQQRHDLRPPEISETLEKQYENIVKDALNPVLLALESKYKARETLRTEGEDAASRWEKQFKFIPDGERNVSMPSSVDDWSRLLEFLAQTDSQADPGERIFRSVQHEFFSLNALDCITLGGGEWKKRQSNFQRYVFSLLDHLFAQESGVISRLGGAGSLSNQLRHCDSKVFNSGSISNQSAKNNLVLVKPNDEHVRKEMAVDDTGMRNLDKLFRNEAQRQFGIDPRVASSTSTYPLIYFESLTRSAEEIHTIEKYRSTYLNLSAERRSLFHLFRGVDELPDIVVSNIPPHPVLCGNPECDHDLRYEPRNKTICPACQNPIWNRCGNTTCGEDDLQARLRRSNGGKMPEPPPHQCPECNHDLKTYWWRCKEHNKKWIATDKEQCPQCLAEYQKGDRRYDDVSRRPDLDSIECPGCASLGIEKKNRVRIPTDLVSYYKDGVNGHSSTAFPVAIKKHGMRQHYCTQQKEKHLLFPTCTEGGYTHHLYRNPEGHFICPEHPSKVFMECFHCGYPIDSESPDLQDHGVTQCPRCRRELEYCHYCSDTYQKLYEPKKLGKEKRKHCPNCSNHMQPQPAEKALLINGDFSSPERPGYCRNIVDCDAARDLWNTSADYEIGTCKVCQNEDASLLNRRQLVEDISRCPVCLGLFGLPDPTGDGTPKEIINGALVDHLKTLNQYEFRGAETCVLCGTRPADTLHWSQGQPDNQDNVVCDVDGKPIYSISSDVQINHIPDKLNFEDLALLLKALVEHKDDYDALEAIRKLDFYPQHSDDLRKLVRNFLKIFDSNSVSGKSVANRLDNICRLHEDERKRKGFS